MAQRHFFMNIELQFWSLEVGGRELKLPRLFLAFCTLKLYNQYKDVSILHWSCLFCCNFDYFSVFYEVYCPLMGQKMLHIREGFGEGFGWLVKVEHKPN